MCITENLEFLRHAISPMILIETDLQENIGAIDGDPQQINHAFMNLYVNAVEKMQE
jgi:signal transduction histidine kinase